MVDIQKIAQDLVDELQAESEKNKWRVQGVALLHQKIVDAVTAEQESKLEVDGVKVDGQGDKSGGSSSETKQTGS